MQLDLRTLCFNLMVFSTIFGVGMILYAKKHKSFVGISVIGLGQLLLGLGALLLALRHLINDFTSIMVANLVIYISVILIYRGLLRFLDIPSPFKGYLCPLLTVLLAGFLYYYKFHVPNINIRIVAFSTLFSVLCFIAVFGLSKYTKECGRTAIRIVAFMFFAVGIFHVLGALWTIFQAQLQDFMKAGLFSSLSVIAAEFIVILTTYATIWIATETLQSALSEMARTDSLTQLYNRRTFEEYCAVEISRTGRNNSIFTIIMCDLDHFKHINDQYGHPFGDEVLKIFAQILRNNVRKQDVVARFGGEEFVILLPDTDSEQGLTVAEHLRETTLSTRVPTEDGSDLSFSVSFGVAHYSSSDNEWKAVLSRADKALYAAKKQGRNRTVCM
ncbi:GGDEF domain-containing protein [Desulfuromonas acetoxidans]|uniref:GGDEF domain-containing protein n=1 Tax=Desulfuromonas acetoxidans TaxID=891 RepID=UPI0029303499|nr:GGDEF domain-containing protein [Desulfuromonas acetoxidans]